MAIRGKGLLLGVIIAGIAILLAPKESDPCAILRKTLLAQQDVDQHRGMPRGFPRVPMSLVVSCGAEALRMPHPYQIRFGMTKTDYDIQKEFFALKKPTVRVRNILPYNESFEHLMVTDVGGFTENADEQLPFKDAQRCLGDGTCALFFDNSWGFDDVKAMLPNTPGDSLEELLKHSRFGNMFCTNLTKARLTARIHSAPYHGSVAVQLAGIKRWKFWDPATLRDFGVHPDETSFGKMVQSRFFPIVGIGEVMLKTVPHYDVITQPGELMYFPSHWTHVVWTDAGWNNMVNLRMCYTLKTLFASFSNALKIHSIKASIKLLLINFRQTFLVSDEKFKSGIAKAHDRARLEGHGAATDDFSEFVKLNLNDM